MPPKKDKKDLPDTAWRTIIESTPLNEETWKVQVVMMESAGSDQDRIYLNKFETFAAEEKRFVIKNICRTETIFMVNQLGGEKKVKDDNLRVFEEGQAFLKDKKDIPSDIIALIIKHLMLKMKEEYLFIQRQRLEVREGMRLESATMVNKAEVRGTVNVSPPEPPAASPPKGKGKKGADNIPEIPKPEEGKKYNTQLRIRGEEWRDKIYVDDFPTEGPNLYVAVTGFVDPLLAMNLIKIGVPISAVVQIRIDAATTKVPSTLFRATKRGQSQTEMLADIANKFWEDVQTLRITNPGSEDYKDTAFIIFTPPYWDSENLSGNPDKIYDELCFLMYDVQDLSRQHLHYLENMDMISVPENIEDDRFNKYYNQQINDLPLECVTCYSVLDSILQTVCFSEEVRDGSSRTSLSSAVTLAKPRKSCATEDEKIEKAETFVKEVFNTLCKTDANRKAYRLTYGEEYETHKPPTIINYGDFAKYPTFHLGNINLDNIVWSSLYCMPFHQLWNNQDRPHGELEAKINFHVNVLLSCFERNDIETAELNRLIHILACRKLYNNRSSLKKKHMPSGTITEFKKVYLKRSILAEPLTRTVSLHHNNSSESRIPSYPSMTKSENSSYSSNGGDSESTRIKFLFDCPDISELVSAAELANGTPINHMIDDFEYFEDFSGVSAFQILLDAFNKFNCVDYKYCEVTDCILMMFFNSHDKDGITRDEWRCHLVTPVCLQDFFDFVLEENYDWIQTEEKIYDEAMELKSQSEYKVIVDPNALQSCIAEVEVASELLMEGSLKYQELAENDEENTTDTTTVQSTKISQKSLSPTSTEIDIKGKKSKTPSAKGRRQSFMQTQTASQSLTEIPPKPFLGYNLSDRRVEVFGKDATYYSRDGTRVVSNYTMTIPTNNEFIVLNVVPGNNYNEFWIHKALGDSATPEIVDLCESFRITTKDQVMINIKKQTYKVPIPPETANTASPVSDDNIEELFETLCYHSLIVTWPNGLITESIYEHNSPRISHIKQYHLTLKTDIDETMRCISLNGEVLIFKENGDIDVLRSDGCVINIKKYCNRPIIPEVPEDLISDVSSEKSKKGKGKEKDKSKDKSSKGSNKSKDEEEEKPIEYEFVIEEFEYIETSGLRQKWIDDVPYTIEKLLIRTATDFCIGEIFSRRMDGTHSLLNKDGVHVVTFPDKTRIISKFIIEDEEIYPEWTEDELYLFEVVSSETVVTDNTKSKASISQKSYIISQASVASSVSTKKVEINLDIEEELPKEVERIDGYISVQIVYTIEHANFTTVTVNKANDKISVESPNNTEVIVDSHNNYKIVLDNVTTATFDGENLHVSYEACPECRSFTSCDIKIRTDDTSLTKVNQNWLRMKDSFFKRVVVNEEGSIDLIDEPYSDESVHPEDMGLGEETKEVVDERQADGKSEGSTISHGKCREMYQAKTIRFFVMQRDLTCSELVHRSLLELYNRDCRWQPWCSINQYDTFGDHRSLLSVLTPVHLTETEKWLMESKLAAKPKYLTYKDLKKDCGKGFYHWMRPYERFEPKPMKPENVLPPRLPRAFILRTLEQQWKEKYRDTYKGAKELLIAILRYRQIMETDSETLLYVPLVDMRPEDERRIDEVVQALAHRIYEDLKTRLAEDVQSRAKADITTKPIPVEEELSVEGEILEEEPVDEMALFEEERLSLLNQVEDAEPMSPNLKRYWRRREEEYKEEQFYKYLLREGSVPPYFRNVLGGAIWWEMNSTATDAMTKAERKHMKCICAAEEATPSESEPTPFM